MKNGNEKVKRLISYILTIFIILIMAIFVYFLYFVNKDLVIKVIGTISLVLISLIWFLFEHNKGKTYVQKQPVVETKIKRFILITRDGEREMEWHCEGVSSFLIGKSTAKQEVDIDLSEIHFCEYISNEHAILNYSNGYWYIEDLNSFNGVGIKKKGEEYALRLKPAVSYKIDEGDIIYISKAKLLVR